MEIVQGVQQIVIAVVSEEVNQFLSSPTSLLWPLGSGFGLGSALRSPMTFAWKRDRSTAAVAVAYQFKQGQGDYYKPLTVSRLNPTAEQA